MKNRKLNIGAILLIYIATTFILQIVFFVLRLMHIIAWHWLWICSPIISIFLIMFLIFLFVMISVLIIDHENHENKNNSGDLYN